MQQRKFKKFTSLKYKPKSAARTVVNKNNSLPQEQPRPTKPSYTQPLKSNTNTFEKVNSTKHHKNKPSKNINERLRSVSPANRKPKQGIIRSRNNSKPIYHLITNTNKKLNNLKTKLNYWNKQRTIIKKKQKKQKHPTHLQIQKTCSRLLCLTGAKKKTSN